MTDVLELAGVTKRYGGVAAVADISISLRRGRIMALLGPSGCGKSTTLRMIAGFTHPDEGTIKIAGKDMTGVKPYERNVGLVFQDYALFPHLTVAQNIAYGLKQRGWARREIPDRIAAMLNLVRLQSFGERFPAALSGGQQQRVALARALATRPELVLLDEPLSALDAKLRQELQLELKEILVASDATTIIVTHDQEEAMSLAEEIVVMKDGKVLQVGAPTAIYRKPNSIEVARFIGRSNWLSGSVTAATPDGVLFDSPDGHFALRAPGGGSLPRQGQLCIRPEAFRIVTTDAPAGRNAIRGRIINVTYLGAEVHLLAELASGTRILAVEHERAAEGRVRGDSILLAFDETDGIIFDGREAMSQKATAVELAGVASI
jgi:putative spermidine/putrescine transport system ATP-binding protein/putrescine transport system ATP-binding protein